MTYERQQVTLKCEPDESPKPIQIFWKKNAVLYKETNIPLIQILFFKILGELILENIPACEAVINAGTANKIPTLI